jgi:preprotein translocase subunit SecB
MEHSIRLIDVQFTEIDCKIKSFDKKITGELSTSMSIASLFDNTNNKKFSVVFKVELIDKEKDFKFKLKAVAHFSTNTAITEEFKTSPFIEMNAPAIAFPYIRVFISNITLNAGYNPVVLPSFNFVKMAEEKKLIK